MFYIIIITVFLCGLLYLLYQYFIWHFDYWTQIGVPGPKPSFYVGNFPKSAFQQINGTYDIEDIYKEYKGKGPFVGIFAGRVPQILAIHPEFIKDVLIRNFKNFQMNEFGDMADKEVDPIFSRNPFMLSGDEWKEKRAEITPAFTSNRIKAMYPIIDDVCKRMTIYIKEILLQSGTDGMDAKELSAKYTTDVVSNCIFGLDSKAFSNEDSIIRKMGNDLFSPSTWFFIYFTVISIFPFLYKLYPVPMVPKDVEKFFIQILRDAINARKNGKIIRDDFLGYLLQLKIKKNLTDIEMVAHTVTFFLDGFETSSIVISYMLYSLGSNYDIQEKLRNEINDVINRDGRITYENLTEMKYLDQILYETLRLYPPTTGISKKCTEPIDVVGFKENNKITIEKQMIVQIPLYSIQRDPEYYSHPDVFDPERFNEENGGIKKYRDMGVFLPFGDGPRICLGMRFAMTQSKAALVEIIRNFNININNKTQEPLVIDPKQFLNIPTGGLWINLELIK